MSKSREFYREIIKFGCDQSNNSAELGKWSATMKWAMSQSGADYTQVRNRCQPILTKFKPRKNPAFGEPGCFMAAGHGGAPRL